MKYKPIEKVTNPYPSADSYRKIADTITIIGNFAENQATFDVEHLDDINYTLNTGFRFIIRFSETEESTDKTYYTSQGYYEDLEKAIKEGNPYFTVSNSVVVDVFTKDLKALIESLREAEEEWDVTINQSLGISRDQPIDYNVMVKYIDWLVKRPDLLETDLLPTKDISDYEEILTEEDDI